MLDVLENSQRVSHLDMFGYVLQKNNIAHLVSKTFKSLKDHNKFLNNIKQMSLSRLLLVRLIFAEHHARDSQLKTLTGYTVDGSIRQACDW